MDIARNARHILGLCSDDESRKRLAMLRAEADFAGARAASEVWNSHNPDDGVGGMSSNPYRMSDNAVVAARLEYAAAREAMELATVTFVSMIPETTSMPAPKSDPAKEAIGECSRLNKASISNLEMNPDFSNMAKRIKVASTDPETP